jgi:hypothetical protein
VSRWQFYQPVPVLPDNQNLTDQSSTGLPGDGSDHIANQRRMQVWNDDRYAQTHSAASIAILLSSVNFLLDISQ